MENKTSAKPRFNLIDALIILLVIVVAAGIVYATGLGDKLAERNDAQVTYVLRISDVKEEYLSLLGVGHTVFNSSTGNELGKISDIVKKKSVYTSSSAVSADGKSAVTYELDDMYDVYITVTGKADVDDRGIAVTDGQKILIGAKFYVRDGAFAATAFCTDFSVAK